MELNMDMLMYMLGGVGGALGGQGSWQQALGGMAQQQMQSQNYAKMMQQMLQQGGKLTLDQEKGSLTFPTSALHASENFKSSPPYAQGPSLQDLYGNAESRSTGATSTAPNQNRNINLQQLMLGNLINPSSSPLNIAGANLVGLTPEHIQSALALRQRQQQLQQQSFNNIVDAMYKGQLMKESDARLSKINEPEQMASLNVPGVGSVTLEEWSTLPMEVRAYSYHVHQALKNGERPLTENEFRTETDPHSMAKLFEWANSDPEHMKWLMEYRKAGATTINMPPGEKAFETAKGRLRAKVTDPEFFFNTQKQLMDDKEKWFMPPGLDEFIDRQPKGVFKDRRDARDAYNYARVLRSMRDQIAAAWGVPADDVFFDTKTGYFYVDGLPIAPAPGGLR